jgi:hypothetical protein
LVQVWVIENVPEPSYDLPISPRLIRDHMLDRPQSEGEKRVALSSIRPNSYAARPKTKLAQPCGPVRTKRRSIFIIRIEPPAQDFRALLEVARDGELSDIAFDPHPALRLDDGTDVVEDDTSDRRGPPCRQHHGEQAAVGGADE